MLDIESYKCKECHKNLHGRVALMPVWGTVNLEVMTAKNAVTSLHVKHCLKCILNMATP